MATSLKRKNTTAELNMASPMFIFRDMITSVSMLGNSGSNSAKVKPPSHLSNLAMGNPELAMYDELLGPCGYGDQKKHVCFTYIYICIYIYIIYILHISSKNHLESHSQVLPSRRNHQEFYAVISWLKHVKP